MKAPRNHSFCPQALAWALITVALFAAAEHPAKQGAEVTITLQNGMTLSRRLADLVPADRALIRRRFRTAAAAVLGADRANALEQAVNGLSDCSDVGNIMRLARTLSAEAAAA